jgi:hypothetical protein
MQPGGANLAHRAPLDVIFPRATGSYIGRRSERVAQLVEHVTFNHGVEGSSPSALTNKIKN